MLRLARPRNAVVIKRILQSGARFSSTLQDEKLQSITDLNVGDQMHGYTVKQVDDVPELFMTAYSLEHNKTGAQHLHIARDDSNNTFSVAFRTTPMDNTGVSHILEHTVLCGSRKFPVRDPFFKMMNRSLATFMNAMTASDWTMYPFSTQNRRDFNNLLSVYLDAVFHPKLSELDFSQEGWRLEHEDIKDRNSPIGFKGVVYNEMKGVFSSQQAIFAEAVQNNLLPNHTYGICSGGDPAYIPDLTWNQLKEFHQSHYHPSNSRFFTYGNFPLEEHLEYINGNYLQYFDKIEVDTEVPLEPRWTTPREKVITCQPDTMAAHPDKQTTVAVNFLLSDITDVQEAFTLSILSSLLTDGELSPFYQALLDYYIHYSSLLPKIITDVQEAFTLSILSSLLTDGELSPFYQALLDANLGSDYSPVNGYNGYTKEGTFSVGLQGLHQQDAEKVKQIIPETIDKVIREGFEQSRIDAMVHRIELGIKHVTSNFGLMFIMSAASSCAHGGDAAEMLKINEKVNLFKQKLADNPQYLQQKVKQYLKDNPHQLTVVMSPDETFQQEKQKQEEQKLQMCIDQLTEADREHIFKLGQELQEAQNRVEDFTCLPCIQLGEIDKKIIPQIVEHSIIDDVPVQHSSQPTNEVAYLKMVSHLDDIPEELKMYVPLFASVITQDVKIRSCLGKGQPTNEVAYLKMVSHLDDIPEELKMYVPLFASVITQDVKISSCLGKGQPTNEVDYLKMVSHLDNVPEELKMYVPLFASVITQDVKMRSCLGKVQPTNEVAYLKMVSHLDDMPEELKMYVPLFASVITQMGAGPYDYRELGHQADLCSGGLQASTHINADPTSITGYDEGVLFSSHCLERNFDRMLELWTEIFDRSDLRNSDRLKMLIRMTAADMAAGLAHAGHSYAMTHSASSLTPASKRSEIFSGITQVSVMKRIAESPDVTTIKDHLIEIGKCVLNKNNLKMSVNATPDFMPTALNSVDKFLGTLQCNRKPEQHTQKPHTIQNEMFESQSTKTHIQLPFNVNYMSKSVKTVPYGHVDFPSLRVLSRLLSWKYLHREIREKGGAYGGGASCANGVMSFFSYRDPNSMETLSVFDRSIDWAGNGQFSDKDIEEAKISVFQQIDKPVTPGQVGSTLFLTRVTEEMRQAARDGLFSVSRNDLLNATQKYLVNGQQPASTSFLGPKNDGTKENPDWKVLQ